jgi:hypothetical protein
MMSWVTFGLTSSDSLSVTSRTNQIRSKLPPNMTQKLRSDHFRSKGAVVDAMVNLIEPLRILTRGQDIELIDEVRRALHRAYRQGWDDCTDSYEFEREGEDG